VEGSRGHFESEPHKHERDGDIDEQVDRPGLQFLADDVDIRGTRRAENKRHAVEEECGRK
jgi:hypothetical protein